MYTPVNRIQSCKWRLLLQTTGKINSKNSITFDPAMEILPISLVELLSFVLVHRDVENIRLNDTLWDTYKKPMA